MFKSPKNMFTQVWYVEQKGESNKVRKKKIDL